MIIKFPDHVMFGTSTSAYQIETAFEHDWLNVRSRGGATFHRTTDHEKRLGEDVEIIASLAPHYRMSLMWSKLQRKPFAKLDATATEVYKGFLKELNARGVKIMMVIHHFANPTWFAADGGWENKKNIECWIDYARQVVETFGEYVDSWNTFNEPNLYIAMAFVAGEFPPFKQSILKANRVIINLAQAHDRIYDEIKKGYPDKQVGISHNCAVFEPENIWGVIPSRIADWCYMTYSENLFHKTDFFRMSYYARIGFDPVLCIACCVPRTIASRRGVKLARR